MTLRQSREGGKPQSKFQKTLQRLAEGYDTPTLADVNVLSTPTPDEIAHFKTAWPQIEIERRRAIINKMNEAAELSVHSDFSDLLPLMLDDGDELVRAQAVEGLWESERISFGRRLLQMLTQDQSEVVRAAAAAGLGNFLLRAELGKLTSLSADQLTEALLTRYNDIHEDEEVRRQALESVAYSSDERVHGAIDRAYHDGDPDMRRSAVFAMGRSADRSWERIVTEELRSKDAAMRFEAATAAGELVLSETLGILGELVHDADIEVRQASVWALGQIGGREARHLLEEVLEGDDESLHEVAEDALAELELSEGDMPMDLFTYDPAPPNGQNSDDDAEKEDRET